MGIGAYRHVVTLQDVDPAVVLDPATWHCAVQSAAGQVVDGLAAFYVRGRFHPGVTLETQILFEGRTLQVQRVNDIDERHQNLELLCVEAVARGSNPGTTPTITTPPQDMSVFEGESATLTVVAAGTGPLAYQWTQAGVDIAGATSASYVTGPLMVTSVYAVRVSNIYSTVTSPSATVTVAPPPDYQETVLADGAIAYWPLDDPAGSLTAHDLAGTGAGTIEPGVTCGVPGPSASGPTAMHFDGTGGIVVPSIDLPSDLTLEAWITVIDDNDRQDAHFIYQRTGATSGDTPLNMSLYYAWDGTYSAVPRLEVTNPFGWKAIDLRGTADLRNSGWHHVVGVFTATTMNLYLDGALMVPGSGMPSNAGHPVPSVGGQSGIGNSFGAGAPWFGDLADVAIYPRALTPAEVTTHYMRRLAGRRR